MEQRCAAQLWSHQLQLSRFQIPTCPAPRVPPRRVVCLRVASCASGGHIVCFRHKTKVWSLTSSCARTATAKPFHSDLV
ncbi:hypothetical protein P7K49_020638, partial [Saguinus oedipus]